ncbi:Fc.00g065460.m01.CDS01 [Cosmosporella sp. VM-42]
MASLTDTARPRFGHDVLCVFDTWQDTHGYLADIIESSRESREVQQLLSESLLAGAEDWHYLIQCARSIQRQCGTHPMSLEGQDVLSYVWNIFEGVDSLATLEPWEETDRLIARAKELEQDPDVRSPSVEQASIKSSDSRRASIKTKGPTTTSHYWSGQPQHKLPSHSRKWTEATLLRKSTPDTSFQCANQAFDPWRCPGLTSAPGTVRFLDSQGAENLSLPYGEEEGAGGTHWQVYKEAVVGAKQATISPYFAPQKSEKKKSPKKRPPPGTVSTVPFAPLTSPIFGVIQEEFGHDPFWLLIAVTFLIRTNGNLAIPMFYKVKELFPTPQHVADPANSEELVSMIRHLGLSVVRVAFMQKYARGFLEDPPRAGVRYKVKNYDRRDFDPSLRDLDDSGGSEKNTSTQSEDAEDLDAWEIGHLTKGKYAIDSWRIFCRDELLGRAEDWNGKGREPEFQPEWMRVMPEDKELRAYLRWMWMREGWEWDPITGERTVLREELQKAVNERRVEYDDTGGLRILGEPRP